MSEADGSRRQAELKATKSLLLADKINISLFKRTMIPALQWLAVKIGDEASAMATKAAVTLAIGWIASKATSE